MSLKRVISSALIDIGMFARAGAIAKVLIGALDTVVVIGMAFHALWNSVLEADSGFVDWVFGYIEHTITLSADQSPV